VTIAPELKAGRQAAIIDYCRACHKAIPVQRQAKLFAQSQRLLKNSNDKAEQALGHTLYANLTAQGLTAPPAIDLSNATAAERQQQVFQAIQQSAVKDWAHFAQVLHATLIPNSAQATLHNRPSENGTPPSSSGPKISKPATQQVS
jgi:hypothetical protein